MKIAMSKEALLAKVNEDLQAQPWFKEGLKVVSAEMKGEYLVMHSDGMLKENGAVDLELAEKLNDFATSFADRYTLQQ
ncbi:hypothetical protein RNI54_004091 [Pseudomonas putida]|jgi:hypothetical protein|nr:hypothetical protein [Salmonella enterica subsp. enterica serovar Enteritidis]ELF6207253.1 hypothetical protein [Pseudomonas putida]